MHRYFLNFRKSAQDRAAEISARAYNHYQRIRPFVGKIYKPFKEMHTKYFKNKYGQN